MKGRTKEKKISEHRISNPTQASVWRGSQALGSQELEQRAGELGGEGGVGKQASGTEAAERKCLIPTSAVASADPP